MEETLLETYNCYARNVTERKPTKFNSSRELGSAFVMVLRTLGETKRINEAIKNNQGKFPHGYVFELDRQDISDLRSKFSTANLSSKTRVFYKG